MNVFKQLADWWFAPVPRGNKEFSESELRALKALRNEPGWPVLLKVLDKRTNLVAERLLHDFDTARVHFDRGHIYGLRDAVQAVENLLKTGEGLDDYKRRAAIESDREAERIATYGTAAWTGS